MSCSEGEAPDAFRQRWRTARKSHKCCECRCEIKAGERYHYASGIWDGVPRSFKTCASCDDVREDVFVLAGFYPPFGSAGCCYTEALHESRRDSLATHKSTPE